MENRHFLNCNIAGFTYYEGVLVFDELKIGTKLELVREPENKFDPYAVAIYYNDHKLGFIPRSGNHQISKFLEMGYNDLFETRIQRIDATAYTENQVSVIIFLKKKA